MNTPHTAPVPAETGSRAPRALTLAPGALVQYGTYAQIYHDDASRNTEDLAFWKSFAAGRVCEVGCGTGRVLTALEGRADAIVGVDPDAEMLAIAKRVSRSAELRQGGIQRIPARDGEFDTILSPRGALSHLTQWHDHVSAARELHRVVRPGGRCVVDVPNLQPADLDAACLLPENALVTWDWVAHPSFGVVQLHSRYENGSGKLVNVVSRTKAFAPTEFVSLLAHGGFIVDHLLGDYDRRVYRGPDPRLIAVCTRPRQL